MIIKAFPQLLFTMKHPFSLVSDFLLTILQQMIDFFQQPNFFLLNFSCLHHFSIFLMVAIFVLHHPINLILHLNFFVYQYFLFILLNFILHPFSFTLLFGFIFLLPLPLLPLALLPLILLLMRLYHLCLRRRD